jgi:hypothetical protein
MSEPKSFLEERIKLMMRKPKKEWRLAAAVLGCLSLTVVAVAAEVAPPNAATSADEARESIDLDTEVLDRYTGDYQVTPTGVMTVTREGNRLFTQTTGWPKSEIFAQTQTDFFYKVNKAQISFEIDAQGQSTGLVIHLNGLNRRAPRIDTAVAQQIAAATAAKVESQTATPASEAALRRVIGGIQTGNPNFAEMSPELAKATREQLPQLEALLKKLGAVQSVEFRGVGGLGWDAYDVKQEHGLSQWKIALGPDGIIMGALVTTGP